MKKYEYKVVETEYASRFWLEKNMNELGKEGWDVFDVTKDPNESKFIISAKRLIKEKKTKRIKY